MKSLPHFSDCTSQIASVAIHIGMAKRIAHRQRFTDNDSISALCPAWERLSSSGF
jgi:hypothetical protein